MTKEYQELLNKELKAECDADKELEEIISREYVKKIMERVEQRREIYTQAYLAKKSGLSRSAYNNYKSGYRSSIKVVTLKRMADVLRCDITDFF